MALSEITPKSEENSLSKAGNLAKTVWNIVRSVGPFAISQSDSMSEAYARHCGRIAAVDLGKELIRGEIEALINTEKQLLQQFAGANPAERIRIKRDIEDISASLRQTKITIQALNYIQAESRANLQLSASEPPAEMSAHWIDKFNELAKAHNEPWRENLLSRALAKESTSPGSVSARVLWLLGTLDEKTFEAFALLLDTSTKIGEYPTIPNFPKYIKEPIPDCSFGDAGIGHLAFLLGDTGLLADITTVSTRLPKGESIIASYHNKHRMIRCVGKELVIRGLILTNLGASIASFYDAKTNPLGETIFDQWISSLNQEDYEISSATNPNS